MIKVCFSQMPQGVVHRQTARWSSFDSHTSDATRRFNEITSAVSQFRERAIYLIGKSLKVLLILEQSICFKENLCGAKEICGSWQKQSEVSKKLFWGFSNRLRELASRTVLWRQKLDCVCRLFWTKTGIYGTELIRTQTTASPSLIRTKFKV